MKSLAIIVVRSSLLLAGAAVLGTAVAADPAAANGVHGLIKFFGSVCTSASPCLEWKNSGTGAGIQGDGTSGSGLVGTSQKGSGLFARSTSGNGVAGTSQSANGVTGTTANKSGSNGIARYGVLGTDVSTDGGTLNAGVSGTSNNGTGVSGASSTTYGVMGQTQGVGPFAGVYGVASQQGQGNAAGVEGLSNAGPGVEGISASRISAAVSATNNGAGDGVDAIATVGVGVSALSSSIAILGQNQIGDTSTTAEFDGGTTSAGDNTLTTFDSSASATFWVGNDGNAHVRGLLFTGGPCSAGCSKVKGPAAGEIQRYVPQESLPTVEDMGEAQLRNGAAYVRIAPDFANVIDTRSVYLVFVTPQGPTRGLYVADKTSQGFEVHEMAGGNASIAFDYRIVAKPYGTSAARLPVIDGAHLPSAHPRARPHVAGTGSAGA